jgi:hypothetical protein
MPDVLERNLAKIKSLNPGWEHRLDDGDIVEFIGSSYRPKVLAQYERINPKYGAARADLLSLEYTVFGAADRAHKSVFHYHYTELNEPVVRLRGAKKLVWFVTLFRRNAVALVTIILALVSVIVTASSPLIMSTLSARLVRGARLQRGDFCRYPR